MSGGRWRFDGIAGILGGEDKKILSTGNNEIDKKIADGLPLRFSYAH